MKDNELRRLSTEADRVADHGGEIMSVRPELVSVLAKEIIYLREQLVIRGWERDKPLVDPEITRRWLTIEDLDWDAA